MVLQSSGSQAAFRKAFKLFMKCACSCPFNVMQVASVFHARCPLHAGCESGWSNHSLAWPDLSVP